MWVGMCSRWPASGTSPRSRSPAASARSGWGDISIEVEVHVEEPGMRLLATLLSPPQRLLEDLDRLRRVRPFRDRARLEVPERPRGAVHDRLREQGRDVRVVPVPGVDGPHRPRVLVVPRAHVGGGGARGVTEIEGADEGPLRLRRAARGALLRPRRRLVGRLERTGRVLLVERLPRLVVVGPRRVGDPPTTPSRTRGRRRARADSTRSPRRGCSRRSRRAPGRTSAAPLPNGW